jgi:NhaA family Na+:H+ antiporter
MADLTEQTTPIRHDDPPGSWRAARRLAERARAPVERFLAVEAASGILLLAAAAIALLWANSPWGSSYVALWHIPLGLSIGSFSFAPDLHFWINDGLMTVFFFVVGLEIRREIHRGELSEPRRAALPIVAAVGGMLVPAGIFASLNWGHESVTGWGIPMATDIAFAVGVLTLLGKRIQPALRILLLTLAVVDDVGAILVIAVFYSSGLSPLGVLILGIGLGSVRTMQGFGVRSPWAYVLPGAVVWAGAYLAGIHPTLAGVLLGLLTPVRAWFEPAVFIERADASATALRGMNGENERALLAHLHHLNHAGREAVSPVERIEHALHGWVAFGVMPLFALANAGVAVGNISLGGVPLLVFLGVSLGLLLGKPVGILAFSWLAERAGLALLPRGVTWPQIGLMGLVAGIGFTVSIFVAQLAFPSGANLETAKVGILIGSGAAAILGLGLGRMMLSLQRPSQPACALAEAEASTEA